MSKDKYPSIFSPQIETIVFIILQISFATRAVLKIGEYITISIQLFRQRLSHKSVKAYATMPIGIMGRTSLAFIEWGSRVFTNKKRSGVNTFVSAVSLYVAKKPKASTPLPVIPFGIVAYAFVGQPFSKQLYTKTVDSVEGARWLVRQTPNILCYLPPSNSRENGATVPVCIRDKWRNDPN